MRVGFIILVFIIIGCVMISGCTINMPGSGSSSSPSWGSGYSSSSGSNSDQSSRSSYSSSSGSSSSSSDGDPKCVIGTWRLDRQAGRTDDILTWNFYSDGTFKDIHLFSNGKTQTYDYGTWQYQGNNRFVIHETSTTMHVICKNGVLTHEENTNDVLHKS